MRRWSRGHARRKSRRSRNFEAARAGDAGNGFAVVAEEVRNLAQRSAEAASETAILIAQSVDRSTQGVAVCDEVSRQLEEIVEGIESVNGLIGNVAAATDQQAQSIDEMNRSVNEIDELTQENAARAEESANASSDLSEQSRIVKDVAQILLGLVDSSHSGSTGKRTRNVARSPRHEQEAVARRR